MAKVYYIADFMFALLENPVSLGDNKFKVVAPFEGEILGSLTGPRVTGFIDVVGSGAGTATMVQIRNETLSRDYFTTECEFRVDDSDANGRAVLHKGVLGTQPTFRKDDVLALDVDGLPGGSDSSRGYVWMTVGMWRQAD